MYESIVVEVHERAKWKRTTLDGTRSFTIYYPFFVVAGALHPLDVAKWHLEKDLLGVFFRIKFLRHTSDFQAAREVEEAAHLLPPARPGQSRALPQTLKAWDCIIPNTAKPSSSEATMKARNFV